jgi:hypothetical protein
MGAEWESTVRTVSTGDGAWRVREVKPKPGEVEDFHQVLIFERGNQQRWISAPMYMLPHWTEEELRGYLEKAKPFTRRKP